MPLLNLSTISFFKSPWDFFYGQQVLFLLIFQLLLVDAVAEFLSHIKK